MRTYDRFSVDFLRLRPFSKAITRPASWWCRAVCLVALVSAPQGLTATTPVQAGLADKPNRMIVLTDIEADPDDTQSLVRLFLYSDVIDLQGLIATTSVWKKTSVAPDSIRAVIRAYSKVHANLVKHDPNYPTPETLQALVTQGRPECGMSAVGVGKDSEGSDLIIRRLDEKDSRPLWISVWGGSNTLAQALFKLRATRSKTELEHAVAKLRIYAISDQDDSGYWIRENFPSLFYIVSPGGNYGEATWGGINAVVPGIDNRTISTPWIAANIQQGHGPMGAVYPDVAYGMEGDTPSWLGLIPNGLNSPEHPDWGGWGGRYEKYLPKLLDPQGSIHGEVASMPETRPIWTNAIDTFTPSIPSEYGRATRNGEKSFKGFQTTIWRWRDDFQNDFAARMIWTTKPYAEANHPPIPVLNHAETLTVRSGEGFGLSARGTTDPDGDNLSFFWFHYPEAGSFQGNVRIDSAENATGAWLIAPKVEKPETIHIILRVTDKGTPTLSRYKRIVVTVRP